MPKLSDVFLALYIDKRREQIATNAKDGPRFVWIRENDGLGVMA